MTIWDRVEEASTSVVVTAITAIGAGCLWLIRLIFTNQKKLEMLEREMRVRDQLRGEDREAMEDMRTDIKEMRKDIKSIFQRGG